MAQVYRVNVLMTIHSQRAINTWHLVTPDTGMTEALLQNFATDVLATIRTNTASSVTFESLEYRRVDISGTSSAFYVPTGWPQAGSASGADLPSFNAMLHKGVASGQPRPNKIRKFLPGILETDTTGSAYAASGTTRMNAIQTALQAYADSSEDPRIVAVSYVATPGSPPEDNTDGRWNEITNFSYSPNIAVMRSRKVGVGI